MIRLDMKKIVLCLALAVFMCVGISASAQVKVYKVKSGYISYSLGGTTSGTHKIWWDNYGDWKREEKNITTVTKMLGMKNETTEHTVVITKGKLVWTADLEKNTGTKAINPMYDMMQAQMGDMSEAEQEDMAMGVLGGLGGQKEGTETINGYECDVIKAMGTKVWNYKNITLKTESNIMGIKSSEVVNEFTPDASVSASKFEPLSNINYTFPDPSIAEDFEEALNNPNGVGAAKPVAKLDYPYSKFQTKMNVYNPAGYQRMGPMKMMGTYSCIWMKSEQDMRGVTVASSENSEDFDLNEIQNAPGVDAFMHNGQKCYYYTPTEEDGEEAQPVLMVYYESRKMIMMVISNPNNSKSELLQLYDALAL